MNLHYASPSSIASLVAKIIRSPVRQGSNIHIDQGQHLPYYYQVDKSTECFDVLTRIFVTASLATEGAGSCIDQRS